MMPRRLLFVSIILLSFSNLYAQIPRTLSYQAVLTDNAGIPKPDGAYNVTFRLFTALSGGVALWTETQALQVKRGLFSAVLGNVTPFGANLTFAQPYWMSLQVAPDLEMSPRLPLTSTAYSLGVEGSVVTARRSGGDPYVIIDATTVSQNSVLAYRKNNLNRWLMFGDNGPESGNNAGSNFKLDAYNDAGNGIATYMFVQRATGNVGIGTSSPVVKLDINGSLRVKDPGGDPYVIIDATTVSQNSVLAYRKNNLNRWLMFADNGPESGNNAGSNFRLDAYNDAGNGIATYMVVQRATGNVGIGTTIPSAKLEVIGRTKTGTLEITAGSDLAEPFDTETDEVVEPGSIMVIDAMNAGKLKVSEMPYDARVAGIVSGAGGVKPGITLQQEGVLEGKSLVAIAGRVYCKADANKDPIEPGDLLTTSDIPGHAMKATERDRSHGAIIGKAMSSLKEGTGLVLVLVNLQ